MTFEEVEQAIEKHNTEIAEIRQILMQVAEQQAANMQQIAANTAGLTELRGILAGYCGGRSQFDS
ncbi:hypothetical protein [Leptothermofonsia sp. ETS-13]|uniref:hypothetical protein n=1 Tax=Leptothermofonsia sp. ETS-13 TaxID=3035696 RepID=UPI003BA1CA3A